MVLSQLAAPTVLAVILSLTALRVPSNPRPDDAPDLSSLSDEDLKAATVHLERTRCYGTCPAYTLTIYGDGHVEYEGKSNVKETGTRGTKEGVVDVATIRGLIAEFARVRYWSMAEDYSAGKCTRLCTDMSTAVTELRVKGQTHRVKHYYGCGGAPKDLFALESAIDKAAKAEQWTGDVSKQGPFGTTCFSQ